MKVKKISVRVSVAACPVQSVNDTSEFPLMHFLIIWSHSCLSKVLIIFLHEALFSNPFTESFVSFPPPLLEFSQWFHTLDKRTLQLFIEFTEMTNQFKVQTCNMERNIHGAYLPQHCCTPKSTCLEWKNICTHQQLVQGINTKWFLAHLRRSVSTIFFIKVQSPHLLTWWGICPLLENPVCCCR